ncbi:MAG: glycosyltransferase family 4 protein [Flavobacteriales bacterium]|nr:glycosyltransferase family 4 protein [Flavobacteriales bacterium]MCB9335010.1 glycosyltransferase family 4 protein [Flavobacteriales bacterium]
MEKKLNILFLASWYPNQLQPQNGNFIQQHALAVANYCNVSVLHIIAREQEDKFIIDEKQNQSILEVTIYYKKVKGSSPIHQLQKLNRRHKAYQLGYDVIHQKVKKIDLVHLNVVFPAGNFAVYLKKKYKIPYLVTEHWTQLLNPNSKELSKLTKSVIRRTFDYADLICPVSENLKNKLYFFTTNQKYKVIPNVVNTAVFKYKEHTPQKRILHISNLKDEHKNITGIIDTIKELSLSRSDFFITIAGNGDADYFNQYAEKLGIPNNLYSIEGSKTYGEVATLMQQHDAFLLYSNYENLPCVIAEAQVCGLPVITTDVGGTAEMVNEQNGILIQPKDNKMLLDKLNQLLDNIANYNQAEIAAEAIKKYSFENVGKQFYDAYLQILNR